MLMLVFFIIAAFMAGSSHCHMSSECFSLHKLECQDYLFDLDMPNNVEALQNLCSNIIPLGHCMLGIMEKCAANENLIEDTETNVEAFRGVMEFIESACDEDSLVYKGIAKNLNCVAPTVKTMDDICRWHNVNRIIKDIVYNMIENAERGYCIIDFWEFYCMIARLDVECGSEVRYASREILYNTDFISSHCMNATNKFSYLEEAFESEFRQGKRGQAAVPGVIKVIAENLD